MITPKGKSITMQITIRPLKITAALLFAIAGLGLTACSSEPDQEPETTAQAAPQPAPRDVPERRSREPRMTNAPEIDEVPVPRDTRYTFVPKLEGELEEDGLGLQVILDGSSKEAFEESLQWVAADASNTQYKQLERALRYLNTYDPRVMGDSDRMRQRVDGMTAEEVINLAHSLNQVRVSRSRD